MESNNFCDEKFLEEYAVFLNQLEQLFENNDDKQLVINLKDESDSDKLLRGSLFHASIEKNEQFELFCKSKVRVFSSKEENTNLISNSLFGEKLPLKKLINNQNQGTKNTIWKYLHLFYFLYESNNKNRKDRKSIISKILKETDQKLANEVKNKLLDIDVNNDTNDMIDDIVKSFEETMSSDNPNPFESIMDITQNITEKYNDKIESGEIELEKLMGSLQNSIPGMPDFASMSGTTQEPKEKVIIDDNFSTDKVDLGNKDKNPNSSGMNLSNMLKMMNSMNQSGGDSNEPNLGGLFSMLNKLENVDNEEDAGKLKEEMDSYLEKELGVDVSKLNDQLESVQNKMTDKIKKVSDENISDNEPRQD